MDALTPFATAVCEIEALWRTISHSPSMKAMWRALNTLAWPKEGRYIRDQGNNKSESLLSLGQVALGKSMSMAEQILGPTTPPTYAHMLWAIACPCVTWVSQAHMSSHEDKWTNALQFAFDLRPCAYMQWHGWHCT